MKNNLYKIVQSITPTDIAKEKEKIMSEINNFQQMVNGGNFDQKMKNDAENMLEYFKKKLHLIVDMDELNNLVKEFNNEKIKYF